MEQIKSEASTPGRIGTDESGKGDFFGPLVIAGFYLPDGQDDVIRALGVRDSKKMTDKRVLEVAETLKAGYPHALVVIGPEKYNELYAKMRNLNKLLAWGHARSIENILEKVDCRQVITDQFGDASLVKNALMKKGRTIELDQHPGAEEDPAVAAASVLARAEFLNRLRALSREIGMELPKGASQAVEEAGVRLVRKHGVDVLNKVAKTHFKTAARVAAAAGA
jgi:ribonuclease HIII